MTPAELIALLAKHEPNSDWDGNIEGCMTCGTQFNPPGHNRDAMAYWLEFAHHIAQDLKDPQSFVGLDLEAMKALEVQLPKWGPDSPGYDEMGQ